MSRPPTQPVQFFDGETRSNRYGSGHLRPAEDPLLFDAGRNLKQIQEWLGHHDRGLTPTTYVHLVD